MSRMQGRNADLRGATFDDADLRFILLEHSRLDGASLRSASIEGATLHGTSDSGADYTAANLRALTRTDPERAAAEAFVPSRAT